MTDSPVDRTAAPAPDDRALAAAQRRHWLGQVLGRALALPLVPLAPLSALAALGACAMPGATPLAGASSSSARARLQDSAAAHGLAAWRGLHDVSLAADGLWWPSPGRWAGGPTGGGAAEGRLLTGPDLVALRQAGAGGHRQVLRRAWAPAAGTATSDTLLWPGGSTPFAQNQAADARLTAAVAADNNRLLWLGPLALADHPGPVNWAEPETLAGQRCDHLTLTLAPSLGGAANDTLSLFIDREQGWLRRLRVTLSALGAAGGTLVVDLADHRRLHGIVWPGRLQTAARRLLPGAAPAVWRLTGLDVDRGFSADDLGHSPWAGSAAAPARPLPPS